VEPSIATLEQSKVMELSNRKFGLSSIPKSMVIALLYPI